MPRINRRALAVLDDVAAQQRGLVTSAQLREIGYADSGIRHRSRQGGPWRRVLPAVYLVSGGGELTGEQRELAALLYVRPPCLLTGANVLRRHGVAAAADLALDEVHVLVPHERRRASTHFVQVQRAFRWPAGDGPRGDEAPLPRAAIDACRTLGDRSPIRAVLTEVVRDGHASLGELWAEYEQAGRRRTAVIRETLVALRDGPVSAPELELHARWAETGLPAALWNPDLFLPTGEFLARPDVYLPEHGVVVEVDSRSHHFAPDDWDRTMRRHARLTAAGLIALHVAPRRIHDDWDGIVQDIHNAVRVSRQRPTPAVIIRRTAA